MSLVLYNIGGVGGEDTDIYVYRSMDLYVCCCMYVLLLRMWSMCKGVI